MKNNQIESWALRVIEKVEAGQPVEDSRVELKAEWPTDYSKAARRIAGHANAARGEWILWLIGVDEQQGVKGAEAEEPTTWLGQIGKQFEGLVPRYFDLNVPTRNGQTVVAIVFETSRAPYVVKNPSFGKQAGEGVALEVPWREGTKVRTATRADLLLLLTEANLLLALLGELEWNLAIVTGRDSAPYSFVPFRLKEFHKAKNSDAFLAISKELRDTIYDAYLRISEVETALKVKRILEVSGRKNSRKPLREPIERAISELRGLLGLPARNDHNE